MAKTLRNILGMTLVAGSLSACSTPQRQITGKVIDAKEYSIGMNCPDQPLPINSVTVVRLESEGGQYRLILPGRAEGLDVKPREISVNYSSYSPDRIEAKDFVKSKFSDCRIYDRAGLDSLKFPVDGEITSWRRK